MEVILTKVALLILLASNQKTTQVVALGTSTSYKILKQESVT